MICQNGGWEGIPSWARHFGGPGGRVERFPNPQSVQEAMFHQGMGDKQGMGMTPGMMMEMNRMMVIKTHGAWKWRWHDVSQNAR